MIIILVNKIVQKKKIAPKLKKMIRIRYKRIHLLKIKISFKIKIFQL